LPSKIKVGHKSYGCSECRKVIRSRHTTDNKKEERAKTWDTLFIGCIHHPQERCNRAKYRSTKTRYCWYCLAHNKKTGEPYEYFRKQQDKIKKSGYHVDYIRSWRRKRKLMGAY
jgi:hypothetical protein